MGYAGFDAECFVCGMKAYFLGPDDGRPSLCPTCDTRTMRGEIAGGKDRGKDDDNLEGEDCSVK